ncbi:MAG: sulfatase-like hydrolase/transferase [Tannerella sp.]|jgi:arylsulfatase A-like enzyme|nr:sulfatase-like hydrolase/transferase [Tannerella sp.]
MHIRNTIIPLAALAVPAGLSGQQAQLKDNRPNIIFVLTDDMGYADVGCYGGKFVPTPNIDKMAEEGLRFTQYYSASPISSASRTGLLTGQNPGRWNITSFLQTKAGNRDAEMADFLDPDAQSLPGTLKASGYTTAHFGKWHMGGGRDVDDAPSITNYGYDEYVSTWESPDPDPLLTATDWIWSADDSIKRWERTCYFVDKTLDFLKRNAGKPCFVNLWPDDMHTPWVGNEEEQEVYPKGQNGEKNFGSVLIEYDRQIGRLIDGLKELGLAENTIVIFTSDNGPAPSFKGSRAGIYRGTKASLWEGGIRMPFIVWNGGNLVPKGKVDETSVACGLDMFESLSRIAGAVLPENFQSDGMDMSKALLGTPQKRTKAICWEYRRNDAKAFPKPSDGDVSPNVAIREGDFKLLMNADGSAAALYNLSDDPGETTPLNNSLPDKTKELSEKALTWRQSLPQLKITD